MHMGGEGMYRVLVGNPEGRRPRHKWKDIKMDLQEVEVWTGSSWLRIGTVGGHI